MSARQAVFSRMREAFESTGVWRLMSKEIKAADYTRPGDPLKIDCGYSRNDSVKLFHALALPGDPNSAKLLAFTLPQLAEGIRRKDGKIAQLTAVVADDLPLDEASVSFALETLERQSIAISPLAQMAAIAGQAAKEMGLA